MDLSLPEAVTAGNAVAVSNLLRAGRYTESTFAQAFLNSVKTHHYHIAKMILNVNQNIVNYAGAQALIIAVKAKDYDMIDLLVSYGADVSSDDYWPIVVAERSKDLDMIRHLLDLDEEKEGAGQRDVFEEYDVDGQLIVVPTKYRNGLAHLRNDEVIAELVKEGYWSNDIRKKKYLAMRNEYILTHQAIQQGIAGYGLPALDRYLYRDVLYRDMLE